MSTAFLFDASNFIVLIGDFEVGLHLLQGLGCDSLDTEFPLAFSEAEP